MVGGSRPLGRAAVVGAFVAFRMAAPSYGAEEPAKPRDIGLTEKVQVRLVTVDVLVLDSKDRPVPGLKPEDFDLRVDGKPVPVDTLDESCKGGVLDEPAAVSSPGKRPPIAAQEGPRRIIWVLDYLHLDMFARERTLETLRSLAKGPGMEGTEVMVAALTGGLRVEQPFTGDPSRVAQTLERMQRDITLWNGHFEHTTEEGLFNGLEALCDILASVHGPKAAVMFSEWQGPQDLGFYETDFRRLSALAADSRVTFYPVEAAGLTAEIPSFG